MNAITPEIHKILATQCFNDTWELIDNPKRGPHEDDLMLQTAFASRYHWAQVGGPLEFARGEWLISRVYILLVNGQAALEHAALSLMWCETNQIGDFDLAFAYEAMARANAVFGLAVEAHHYTSLARAAAENIASEEDRSYFLRELSSIPTI